MSSTTITRRIGTAVAVALAAAAAVPAVSAAAGVPVSGAPKITTAALEAGKKLHGADVTEQQALQAYWTPARMAAAKPMGSDADLQAAMDRFTARESLGGTGLPSVALPPLTLAAPGGQQGASGEGGTAGYNPNLPTGHPTARTNGKVFFTTPGGGGGACSGAIVNSAGADQVWTAGHCVHGGAGSNWFTNWVFVPNYDDDLANPRPYGTWTSSARWALTSWTNSSDFGDDFAVANMNMQYGYHIREYFGGQGFRVNNGLNQFQNAMGYTAMAPYDGGNLIRCWGYSYAESANTYRIPCDLNRGSSGGPHLNAYDGNWGYINGINSRVDSYSNPTWMASPTFDNSALTLWNHTKDM